MSPPVSWNLRHSVCLGEREGGEVRVGWDRSGSAVVCCLEVWGAACVGRLLTGLVPVSHSQSPTVSQSYNNPTSPGLMTEEDNASDSIVTLSMEGEEVQEDHSSEAQDYFKESYR